MKKIEWLNDDRMKIDTGHKAFDLQTNIISTGNIIANTLHGWHVRAHWDVEVGFGQPPRKPGELQLFDLGWFDHMPTRVKRWVRELAEEQSVWVYHLFHYNSGGRARSPRKISHGWVVTRNREGTESIDHAYDILLVIHTGPTYKSDQVLRVASEYLGDPTDNTKHRWVGR